jgi:hypothetical protein
MNHLDELKISLRMAKSNLRHNEGNKYYASEVERLHKLVMEEVNKRIKFRPGNDKQD